MPLLPLKPKSVKHGKTLHSLSLKTECLPEDSEERQTTATALLLLCVQRGGLANWRKTHQILLVLIWSLFWHVPLLDKRLQDQSSDKNHSAKHWLVIRPCLKKNLKSDPIWKKKLIWSTSRPSSVLITPPSPGWLVQKVKLLGLDPIKVSCFDVVV